METPFTKHPYADARNAVVSSLALWTLAVALAANTGAFERFGGAVLASLFLFTGGIAVAAATMDRRIAAWIASWRAVRGVAGSAGARPLAAALALALPAAFALGANALAHGLPGGVAGFLLAAIPPVAGLAAALLVEWARGPRPAGIPAAAFRKARARSPAARPAAP